MQQNGVAILIVSGEVKIFSDFFLKAATQGGGVLEITPVEDESFLKKSFERM